jgi:lipoprotein-releasing system permease protein
MSTSQHITISTPQHITISTPQHFTITTHKIMKRNFSFYVARRYMFSKKSVGAINVISFISVAGVAVGTMALVIVLSVFNGFHDLVASLFTNFDPQIEVVPVKGKTINADAPELDRIRHLDFVDVATDVVEDQAIAVYGDRQRMVTVMGVDENFDQLTNISDILYGDGDFTLRVANLYFGVPGIRLAQDLGLGARWADYLKIYAPVRRGQLTDLDTPTDGFVVDSLLSPGVVYAVNQNKYDRDRIITSIYFARQLFDQDGMLSSLQLRLKPGTDLSTAKREIKAAAGEKFRVLDRFEQQADTFRIMQIEKVLAYVFLTFILIVACFNIISSLSMLIIDKKNDINTLHNLGANDRQIQSIFLYEGRIISAVGALIGIGLGLALCGLQQAFGFVKMGESSGTFIVNAYPVSVHYWDVLVVFITVILIGWAASWIPARRLRKQILNRITTP